MTNGSGSGSGSAGGSRRRERAARERRTEREEQRLERLEQRRQRALLGADDWIFTPTDAQIALAYQAPVVRRKPRANGFTESVLWTLSDDWWAALVVHLTRSSCRALGLTGKLAYTQLQRLWRRADVREAVLLNTKAELPAELRHADTTTCRCCRSALANTYCTRHRCDRCCHLSVSECRHTPGRRSAQLALQRLAAAHAADAAEGGGGAE